MLLNLNFCQYQFEPLDSLETQSHLIPHLFLSNYIIDLKGNIQAGNVEREL